LQGLGLEPYVPLEYCSNVATAIDISKKRYSASEVVQKLSTSFEIDIAAGMGADRDKVIRIGTMGEVTSDDVDLTLDALREILK